MRSSHVPRPREQAKTAPSDERAGLPYSEPTSPDQTYADASGLAQRYPVEPLPLRTAADKVLIDTRWQEICEEISAHGALDRHYLD